MTVAELINELEKMPQDERVKLDGARGYYASAVIYNEDEECVVIID